jgi:hypothetical protein
MARRVNGLDTLCCSLPGVSMPDTDEQAIAIASGSSKDYRWGARVGLQQHH